MDKTKNNKEQSIFISMNIHKYLLVSVISLVIFFGLAGSSQAANWYVQPSGGTGSGASWTAAWNGMNGINWSSVSCGDTIWIAGGTYTQSLSPQKNCTSGAQLYIRRARSDASECTGASGWSSGYDSTVHQVGAGIVFDGSYNYITISGRTTASGGSHGWWIDYSSRTGGMGINWPSSTASYNTIEYMDIQGPGNIAYTSDGRGIDLTPWPSNPTGNTFSHIKIWNWESGVYVVSATNTTFEYMEMYGIAATNPVEYHPNGIYTQGANGLTVRYSKFHSDGSGIGIGEGIFCEQTGGCSNWNIYGNIWYGLTSKIIQITSPASTVRIFNNTFANCSYTPIQIRTDQGGACTGSSETRNNLFYSSAGYNTCGTMSNNIAIASSPDPFVDKVSNNYRILSNTDGSYPRNAGTNLSSYFTTDMDGATFGADGIWDIGAYEYVSSSPDTPPVLSNGSPSGTLPFGTTQTTMSVTTNENATCRWSSSAGVAYSSMANTFSTTGGRSHSTTITGLSNGQTYNRYVRCEDSDGYANASDYKIAFSVDSDPAIGDLIAAYSFNEGSGTQANDSSGNANTGSISGAAWTTSGKYGQALSFDGSDDYVEVLTNGWLPDKGTLELWVKASSFGVNPSYLFGHTTFPEWANRIQLYTDDADGWLDAGLGDSHTRAANIENLNTGQWYHIALTWNGTTYNVFVNGILKANGTYTGLTNLASSADIGNDGNPADRNEAFNGTIDEIRVYNKVLSQSEIQTDMNTPIGNIDTTPPAAPTGLTVD